MTAHVHKRQTPPQRGHRRKARYVNELDDARPFLQAPVPEAPTWQVPEPEPGAAKNSKSDAPLFPLPVVWLVTCHSTYRAVNGVNTVAVKMLEPLEEEAFPVGLLKFELLLKRRLKAVTFPLIPCHGR